MINSGDTHPIERIMDTAMTKIRSIIDADTIIGNPVKTEAGTIIPISKVSLGFVTGGGEYSDLSGKKNTDFPFAGGSGGGMSVVPIGFLFDNGEGIKVITMDNETAYDKLFSMIPGVVKGFFKEESN